MNAVGGAMENLWQFMAVSGTAASIAGVILAWQTRDTKKFLERLDARHVAQHATAQGLLTEMEQRHAQAQRSARELLERMDRAADQRAEVLNALRERR